MIIKTIEEWRKVRPKDKWKSQCPLCIESELVIWKWKHWFIYYNKYPICGIDKHLMASPINHVIYTKDLTKEQWWEFKDVQDFMKNFFKTWSYFSFIREDLDSRSLEHLHYHFVPGIFKYNHLENIIENQ